MVHEIVHRKPCTRCLLAEAGEKELSEAIAERIALIPDNEKADEKLYKERLAICRSCAYLNAGTCTKCGCYAELRAAKKRNYCPDERKKW